MKIKLFLSIISLLVFCRFQAQVGIGTTNPNPSSVLDISSTQGGLLIPRMSTSERNLINSPVNSLLIFNTDTQNFEYYSNGQWLVITVANNCDFLTILSNDEISLEKGDSASLTLDVITTSGVPGNISTTLLSTSSNIVVSGFNVTATSPTAPTQQTIDFTIDNSSTANIGDTATMVLQVDSDCGITKFVTITITITGCDFTVTPDVTEIHTSIPSSGNLTLDFNLVFTQSGSINGAITSVFSTNGYGGLTFNGSSGCNYSCASSVNVVVSNSVAPGTYPFNVTVQSDCGTSKMLTLTVVVDANPRNCKQILADNPSATDGVYQIDPDGIGSLGMTDCYCDMTTDGGGWTLVLNYNHLGGTNPNSQPRSSTLPLLGSTSLGIDESNSINWGHTNNVLLNNFNFNEVRFFGRTSSHSRVLHFKIAQTAMINFFKTGVGGVDLTDLRNNFVPLSSHNSDLPFEAFNGFTSTGDNAMLNRPFYRNGSRDWRINIGDDWEMDDNSNNASNNTIHQVWIR